jgi:phage FluMu protein Com
MAQIRCTKCGNVIEMDDESFPYKGELACEKCKNVMRVDLSEKCFTIETNHPNPYEDFSPSHWYDISELERESITEAAFCLGVGAYTASEFMSLRNLESVCRRYYEKVTGKDYKGSWASIIEEMAEDPQFKSYTGALHYFREVRNRVGHPEGTSSKLDAESSYKMSIRLAKELVDKLR